MSNTRRNWRYNQFTGIYYPKQITDEVHTIEYHEAWNAYGIQLLEAPSREFSVDIVENVTGGITFAEVGRSVSPSAGEFRVDYDATTFFATGRIEFNAADDGKSVLVDYRGLGEVLKNPPIPVLISRQVFTSSGTWTKPEGLSYVSVKAIGGGGGGGANTTNDIGGGGGGGGGISEKIIDESALAATVSVTVGSGGTGAVLPSTNGTAGGNSSFGAHCVASGGQGATAALGGASGLGSSGDLNYRQSPGQHGIYYNVNGSGGHGGGSGGIGSTDTSSDGGVGNPYGGGGGGGFNGISDTNGGDGASGVVIVENWGSPG